MRKVTLVNRGLRLCDAPGRKIDVETPTRSLVGRDFARPAKRIARDFRKAPPDQLPVWPGPELDDIVALLAADHLEEILGDRVGPLDLPCIDPGIIDPKRRAVGIDVGRSVAATQFAARRDDPDVLDCAAFQRPAEMPFALAATL